MYDPISTLTIDDKIAKLISYRAVNCPDKKIVIIPQAFDDPTCQINISELIRKLGRLDFSLICLDGLENEYELKDTNKYKGQTIEQLIQSTRISAGVISALINSNNYSAWGIDDKSCDEIQTSVMHKINLQERARKKTLKSMAS